MKLAWRENPSGAARPGASERGGKARFRAIIPEANKPRQAIAGMEIIAVRRVEEAFNRLRELE